MIATASLWPLRKPQYWWRHHPGTVLDLFWIQIITPETLDYTSHFLTINVFKVYLYTVVCSIIKSLQEGERERGRVGEREGGIEEERDKNNCVL